jgi:SAM-dependent methyltransferase
MKGDNRTAMFVTGAAARLEEVLRQLPPPEIAFVPDVLGVDIPDGAKIQYPHPFSIVDHADKWLPLRGNSFSRAVIVGNGVFNAEVDLLAAVAQLGFSRVDYADGDQIRDITQLVQNLRVDFFQQHPTAVAMAPAQRAKLVAEINAHYLNLVSNNGGLVPAKEESQASRVKHFQNNVGLAQDLMMRCPEVSGNSWWVYAINQSDELVHSLDLRLAYARLLERLPNVRSTLEVGCGSGFVSLFMAATGKLERVSGCDVADNRVRGARLLATLNKLGSEFMTASAERLPYGDGEFDLAFTCFVLEQCKDILEEALDELLRVSRRWVVLFEPSTEAFPTLAGLIHIPANGFQTRYADVLSAKKVRFSILRPVLRHYYNPGALYIIAAGKDADTQAACWALESASKDLLQYT